MIPSRGADGQVVAGPAPASWKGRNKPHRGDRAWVTAWSPEQIANRITLDFPDDESIRISHEAIYQALMSKAAVRSSGSWSAACAGVGRCRCRSLNGAMARVQRAVRHSPGLRSFSTSELHPGLAWRDDSATKRRRPLGWWCPMCTFCKPECCSTSVSGFGWEISHGRRPLKRRVVSVVPRPNAAITI